MMIDNIEIKGEKLHSKSSQIVELIKSQISAKTLRPGEKLPTVQEFGKIIGASHYSVCQAFAKLSKDGIISTVRGAGTFIADAPTVSKTSAKASRAFCIISGFSNNDFKMESCHPVTTAAILDECKEMNIKGRFLSPNIDISSFDEIIEELKDRPYDGVIWLYPILNQWAIIELLHSHKIPIVATSHSQYAVSVPSVQGNEVGAGQITGRHLVSRGCNKIVFMVNINRPSGDIRDIRSGIHIGRKIGLLNAFEDAGMMAPEIVEEYYTCENYNDVLKKAMGHIGKKTCLMLGNTKELQVYLERNLTDAISMFRKCELIIATAEKDYNLLKPLANKIDFMVSIHPLWHIGRAAVNKLVNIIEGKFEDTTTLVNEIVEKFDPDKKM